MIQMSIGNHRYGNTLMGDSERVVGLDNYETLDIYNSLFATTTTTTTTVSNITTAAGLVDWTLARWEVRTECIEILLIYSL